jgi:hypothetical protein
MQLKFYLNKFLKVDNIENYTLGALKILEDTYDEFKEKTDGLDPDFPGVTFKTKGTKLNVGSNVYSLLDSKPDSEGAYMKMPTNNNTREE